MALREEWGVRDPRALLKRLAALAPGETLELPDGTTLAAEDVQVALLTTYSLTYLLTYYLTGLPLVSKSPVLCGTTD